MSEQLSIDGIAPAKKNIGRKLSYKQWLAKRDNWDAEYEAESYDRGFFERSERDYVRAIPALTKWIESFEPTSICDMGCGPGFMVAPFVDRIPALGIDIGVGSGYALPDKAFRRVDLTRALFDQIERTSFDLVLSLEVWEHLPRQHESIFVDNLVAVDPRVLIVSVAKPGQWGRHHYNCRTIDEARDIIEQRGYVLDSEAAEEIRTMKYLASYYRKAIQVFRR